jgi:N-methylhydantoinase A
VEEMTAHFDSLSNPGRRELIDDGAAADQIVERRSTDLRYRGQSFTLTVAWTTPPQAVLSFNEMHQARYGHALELPVELVNVRCDLTVPPNNITLPKLSARPPAQPRRMLQIANQHDVPLFERAELCAGQRIKGPAVIAETMATTFVDERWQASVDYWGHLFLTASDSRQRLGNAAAT